MVRVRPFLGGRGRERRSPTGCPESGEQMRRRIPGALRVAIVIVVADALVFAGLSIGLARIGAHQRGAEFYGLPRGDQYVVGTVSRVGTCNFTVVDRSGRPVSINEQYSTAYFSGNASAWSSAVVGGARVLVLGSGNMKAVTAQSVMVLPFGTHGPRHGARRQSCLAAGRASER
jgi:hypothetical protein